MCLQSLANRSICMWIGLYRWIYGEKEGFRFRCINKKILGAKNWQDTRKQTKKDRVHIIDKIETKGEETNKI